MAASIGREPSEVSSRTLRYLLVLLLVQSIGIRFPKSGVIFGVLSCCLLLPRVRLDRSPLVRAALLLVTLLWMKSRSMEEPTALLYDALIVVTAFLFAQFSIGIWDKVERELLAVVWAACVHALVSFCIFQLVGSVFTKISFGGMAYHVLGPFIVSSSGRATSVCWEPGLMQYIANLGLLLGMRARWPYWKLGVMFAAVVATQSTAGVFGAAVVFAYFLTVRARTLLSRRSIVVLVAVLATLVGAATVFRENVEEKLGGSNSSGLARLRDIAVGWELLEEKPLFGHGELNEKYLMSQSSLYEVTASLFSKEYLDEAGELDAGYTNGFFAILTGYGVVVGGLLLWWFARNRLIQGGRRDRIAFVALSFVTFMSEPITWTPWFFMLVMSGMNRAGPQVVASETNGPQT